jgi:hypothetical protein
MTTQNNTPPNAPKRPEPNLGKARARMVSEENVDPARPHTVPPRQTMGIPLPPIKGDRFSAPDAITKAEGRAPSAPPPPIPHDPVPYPPPAHELTRPGMPAPPARTSLDSQQFLMQELTESRAKVLLLERQVAGKEAFPTKSTPPKKPERDWMKLLYGLGGGFTLFLGGAGTYLGARAAVNEHKVDTVEQKLDDQKTAKVTIESRVRTLERYAAALARHSDCVDAERDSAIERGTGHTVEGDHGDVEWLQQSQPELRLRVIWSKYPWYVQTPCPQKPRVLEAWKSRDPE